MTSFNYKYTITYWKMNVSRLSGILKSQSQDILFRNHAFLQLVDVSGEHMPPVTSIPGASAGFALTQWDKGVHCQWVAAAADVKRKIMNAVTVCKV